MKDFEQEDNDNEITFPLVQNSTYVDGSTSNSLEENSPIEQVALTVPITDDPSLPVVTLRMWTLGTVACVLLSFLNQFFCDDNRQAFLPGKMGSVYVEPRKTLTFWVALIVVVTTQVLGFGWAGIYRRYLVEPATMWWPQNLVQVSLFRALHDKDERPKGGLTRNEFFIIAFICNFAYYALPGYLFPMLTSFFWLWS
uniref:Oligopeptide transporter 7-like n=1 Tax=Tanacetum cinerariifolium TaxID=118510 RepID=A0A6L2KVQ5_TANCI|nr:oligopeptide transporter 7-like [Tanacetum cinerariifolium]